MRHIDLHIAGALMALLGILCLISAAAAMAVVGGVVGVPAGALAAVVTFQALRVPVGRAAGRLLDH